MAGESLILLCRHCKNTTVLKVRGEYSEIIDIGDQLGLFEETEKVPEDAEFQGIFEIITHQLMQCSTCTEPTLAQRRQVMRRWYYYHPVTESSFLERIVSDETVLIYPVSESAIPPPGPANDMPPEIAEDFNEARSVFGSSPRASAALLRLAIQKLCKYLGQSGKNMNDDIAELVKAGLPVKIQQSLDIVRVIGNNAVHPGEIDLRDNQDTVLALFNIVNFIVEEMITRPREIEDIYNKLPDGARKQIEKRDRTSKTTSPS